MLNMNQNHKFLLLFTQGLEDAVNQLRSLAAIENKMPLPIGPASSPDLKLTELGRTMAGFPLDARFSKVLIASVEMGCM
jgi:HrpA-like RNA helicase